MLLHLVCNFSAKRLQFLCKTFAVFLQVLCSVSAKLLQCCSPPCRIAVCQWLCTHQKNNAGDRIDKDVTQSPALWVMGLSRFLFSDRNLVYPLLVSSAFEGSGEELGHDAVGFFGSDETAGHDEYVGIVVLAGQVGYLRYPAQGGTYPLVLVQCHSYSFTTATDGNARIALACFNGPCQWMGEVRIITAFGGVGTEVFVGPAAGVKPLLHVLLQFEACVVGC